MDGSRRSEPTRSSWKKTAITAQRLYPNARPDGPALSRLFRRKRLQFTGQIAWIVLADAAVLGRSSAVDALGGMRHRLQASHLDRPATGIAFAVAACTNSLQCVLNFGQLATFNSGELAAQLLLLRGDGRIHLVTHAGVGRTAERPDVTGQGAAEGLAPAIELLLHFADIFSA